METEKILCLRKYVTLLQTGLRSRIARLHLHTYGTVNLPCKGYVFCYVPQQFVQTHLRPENYIATNNRMFSTTVAQSSVDDIDQKLMLLCNDIKKGQVSANDLKKILNLCDYQPRHSTSVLLLKCCANLSPDLDMSERQKLIDQVWDLAKRNSKGITLDHYNTLLHVQLENFDSMNPTQFLANMTVEPDENTYCLLLNVAAKAGNSKYLSDIMSVIKKKNILFDMDTFNTLMQIYANNGNIAEAEHIITLMQDAKLSTARAYTELACAYAKIGDIPNLIKILNDEPQSDTSLLKITKVLSSSDNGRHIPVVLNFLTDSSTNKSEISKTITELISTNQITGALTIINSFALNDATKDFARNLTNSFLNELIMMNAPVADITRYAINFMDMDCEPFALVNVAEIALKLNKEDLCFAIFDAMNKKNIEVRSHYYWPLLVRAHHSKGEAKIISILHSMKNAGVQLDFNTMFNFVYPYINTANPHITLQRLQEENVTQYSIMFTPLLTFLLSRNRLHEAIQLCQCSRYEIRYKEFIKLLARIYLQTGDVQNCVTLLTMYPQGRDFVVLFLKLVLSNKLFDLRTNDVHRLLKEFAKHKTKIPRESANHLKKILSNNFNDFDESLMENLVDDQLKESIISIELDLEYMNTKELECLFVELNSKYLFTNNILCKLFKMYCDQNNLKKAEEMKYKLDECQYKWTYGMKLGLFELYIKNSKLNEAMMLLSDINNVQIDNIKILMFATELVKANRPFDAFEIIKKTNNINHKMNAREHCSTLLYTLLRSQYYNQTKDMLKLLIEKRYCVINIEVLRPLVALSLEHNDIPQAVNTFMTCVRNYKKMPLVLELLTALLQYKDNIDLADKYIKEMYQLIVELQNVEVANTIFMIALATLNKTQKLQNIMQNHKFSMHVIIYYTNYVNRASKVDSLLRIFEEMTNNLQMKNNQIILCDLLINIYSKKGDYNGALDLWNKICAKDIKFSKQSEQSFIQLLLLNKVPLPPKFQQHNSDINVINQ